MDHPLSIDDKDYLKFNVAEDKGIVMFTCITRPYRMITSSPLKKGVILIPNIESLLALEEIQVLGRDFIINECPELYDLNKRFLEDSYKPNYYIEDGKQFSEGVVIENLDTSFLIPFNDSFDAQKEFFRTNEFAYWAAKNGFSASKHFFGPGIPSPWGEISDLDNGLKDLITDFNKVKFLRTSHFCCSGLFEDHQGQDGYCNYGFIRFSYDDKSNNFHNFKKELEALDNMELTDFISIPELRIYPNGVNHDQSIKQGWAKVHELIKKYLTNF